jgi:hypothetical protein
MTSALIFLAALQAVHVDVAPAPGDTLELRPDSAAMATAYEDDATRELVRLARGRRGALDASVFHYTALSRQRISVGIRALRRDRLLYRRETASTVDWWRDRPSRVEVHGAREAIPVAIPGVQVPEDLAGWVREFVPKPGDDRLPISPNSDGFAWHPLIEGGEALYRYETGDTTVLRLPDGREVRLVELRVTPRERDFRVVTGSFWIELEDHAVVQAVFRPARAFDLERDLESLGEESGEADEVPDILKPVQLDVRYMTMEYGLWEMRWWMPRLMAFHGVLRMGAVRAPITFEVAYSDYTVEADRHGLSELPPVTRELAGDPYGRAREYEHPIRVVVPEDTVSLLDSEQLAASFFGEGEALITEAELRELGERLEVLPPPPWELGRPRVTPPWELGRGLLRYNRVEGFSVGARLDWDLTRLRTDHTARIGMDGVPRVEAGVVVPRLRRDWRGVGYWRRLTAMNPALRPLATGNSLSALLIGRDDGMYFEASGLELAVTPVDAARYELRLYAERQRPVRQSTDFAVLRPEGDFRPNLLAADADQVGMRARYRIARGLDPAGFRWGGWLDLTAETGSFTFVRPGIGVRGSGPLVGQLLGGVELAAGTTLGGEEGAPPQSAWLLGGAPTLRGFPGGALGGPDYARARAELSTRFPAARFALFADAGWAGELETAAGPDVAVAVGVGASALDGLVRLDLARAVQPVERWRLDLYLDALF